jgi:hypothetical protein
MPALRTRARVSYDTEGQAFGALLTAAVISPLSSDEQWSALELDSLTLRRMSPARLLELLADLSPEVSRELWNFLRMCNPGYEIVAMRPGGATRAAQTQQAVLDAFLAQLAEYYGALDVIFGRLFLSAFLRGALLGELVLSETGLPIDLATPDPASVSFRQVPDPERGVVWQLGQWQRSEWVALDRPTITYIPVDPLPGSPYGRAIAAPAVFPAIFLLAMLHDLRRVVQQQGWPRIDISINAEKLRAAMPESLTDDPEAFKEWVSAAISEASTAYSELEPDDAYIHLDAETVNRPVGAVDASSLGAVGDLIEALERMLTRALKSMPLLMGITESTSEANANRQWEVYAASIKAVQHLAENLLGRLLTLALRASGVPAVAQVRFAELRAAEMLRDAQTEAQQIENAVAKYNAGFTSQDEASEAVTGHKADAPAPRAAVDVSQVPANPDGGGLK